MGRHNSHRLVAGKRVSDKFVGNPRLALCFLASLARRSGCYRHSRPTQRHARNLQAGIQPPFIPSHGCPPEDCGHDILGGRPVDRCKQRLTAPDLGLSRSPSTLL